MPSVSRQCGRRCPLCFRSSGHLKIFFALGLLVCLLFLHLKLLPAVSGAYNKECYLTDEQRNNLRYAIKTIAHMMDRHNVTYWLDFGTLLGVVKFQDIIPWDHDGDISYVLGSGSSEFHEELAAHGIQSNGLIATYKGLSIDYMRWIPKTGTFNGEETLLMEKYYPAHIWKSDNIVVRYHHKLESFPQSWVVPSKKINFQGVQVTIPNSPEVFLANRYPYSYRLNINVPYKWKCYIPCAFRASKWCQERRGS